MFAYYLITIDLKPRMTMKHFYPDSQNSPKQEGRLKVYLNDTAVAPLEGRYEVVSGGLEGDTRIVFHLSYGGKEYSYFRFGPSTRDNLVNIDLMEDVTAICKEAMSLPEGVIVFRVQQIKLH